MEPDFLCAPESPSAQNERQNGCKYECREPYFNMAAALEELSSPTGDRDTVCLIQQCGLETEISVV